MTHVKLFNALKEINIPVAYDHFDSPVTPPFIVYRESNFEGFYADDVNYYDLDNFEIELVTKTKDLALETLVSNKLKENDIPYIKSSIWDNSEKIYHIIYEI